MALPLARFLFGFSVSWIVAAILLAATLVCIRLIGIVVHAFDNENTENIAGGACVLVVAIGALVGIYMAANGLHDLIGSSAWVGNMPNWLAGADNLSATAVLGALAGLALMGGIPFMLNRRNALPDAVQSAKKAVDQTKAKAIATKAAKTAAAKVSAAKALSKKAPSLKRARVAGLGWIALFLLLTGAAVFVFAFSLDPHSLGHIAGQTAVGNIEQRAARARYVYIAALSLLGGSAFFFILWILVRRKT
jgi:hypothetical protein